MTFPDRQIVRRDLRGIARFGVDGDYLSGMRFATDGPLKEAKTRAIVAGFLMPNAGVTGLAPRGDKS